MRRIITGVFAEHLDIQRHMRDAELLKTAHEIPRALRQGVVDVALQDRIAPPVGNIQVIPANVSNEKETIVVRERRVDLFTDGDQDEGSTEIIKTRIHTAAGTRMEPQDDVKFVARLLSD